jgi:hypothetical protein
MDAPYSEWKSNVQTIVAAFADFDFQSAAWRGEIPTSFGSPGEMMCVFFDDLQVPEFLREYSDALGRACVDEGNKFVSDLEAYEWPMQGQFIDALELLAEARWRQVCSQAGIFLRELNDS